MKYYGATTNGFAIPGTIRETYGLLGTHQQYRLVIKAKSKAAANRRWKEVTGSTGDIFLSDNTSETGNGTEIEMCDKYGEILSTTSGNREYVDLKEVVKTIRGSNNG